MKCVYNDIMIYYTHIKQNMSSSSSSSSSYQAAIAQPSGVHVNLFPHQLKSIEDMERLETNSEIQLTTGMFIETRVGLLSDTPGYGKTLSMIGLIDRTRTQELPNVHAEERVQSHNYVRMHRVEMLKMLHTSVILVNVSLISQWIAELERTDLKFTFITKPSEVEQKDLHEFDVVLISNNVHNMFASVYKKFCFKRFVIDEPMSFKLSMEPVHARFYWLITGTPNELYLRRRTGFLNDLLPDAECSDVFSYLILRNDDQMVKASYDMPVTQNTHYKCCGNIASIFEGLLPDHLIEKIEAYNFSDVLDDMNVNVNGNTIVPDDSPATSQSLIDLFRDKKTKRREELGRELGAKSSERIQLLDTHLSLFEERVAKYLILQKCLCGDHQLSSPVLLSCCQNIFCDKCVETICPLCRTVEMKKYSVHSRVKFDEKEEFPDEKPAPDRTHKITQMMNIVGDAKEKKILIFSNYNETFTLIKKSLDERRLAYLELKGTKEKRDNTIDMYKTGAVNILLLNTIHSGAGLNLQETTDIILFHRIHDYQKIQVIGRANRIGRKVPLHVHYLE